MVVFPLFYHIIIPPFTLLFRFVLFYGIILFSSGNGCDERLCHKGKKGSVLCEVMWWG